MYFNGAHGCLKCTTVGIYSREVRYVCFPNFNAVERTDHGFRNRSDPLHHRENSLLEDIVGADGKPFLDMVRDFVIADSLHLLHEGVMKRLIGIWMNGSFSYKSKWKKPEIESINSSIHFLNKEMPSDVHRQIRSLKYLKYFKATEFRTIMLYVGMVLFKSKLPQNVYVHFLRLCLAVRICSCRTYVKQNLNQLARTLFKEYCANFQNIYGNFSVVSNIHNIIHISDDVDRFGSLSDISTYVFENYLREIKYRTQPSKLPLEQIIKRLIELSMNVKREPFISFQTSKVYTPQLKYEFEVDQDYVYKYIRLTPNVFLSTRKIGDKWFLTHQNEIVRMEYSFFRNDKFIIYGFKVKQTNDFFTVPYTSRLSDIYSSKTLDVSDGQNYQVDIIKAKMMCASSENEFVFIPLLHSIDELAEYNLGI